jgi:hypothetical protein
MASGRIAFLARVIRGLLAFFDEVFSASGFYPPYTVRPSTGGLLKDFLSFTNFHCD